MSKIATSSNMLIGNTPLLELVNIEKEFNLKSKILAKIEGVNIAGSVKDRVALEMINEAEKKGILKEGSVIIEPTSGNTGIGLCSVAASRGYKCIIVMPDTMSVERRQIMKAYGAEIVLSEGKKGMQGSIDKAEELAKQYPNSFIPNQFSNPSNPIAHYKTTGPEIWEQTDGQVDIFICGIGTGGTISGVGKFLKEKNPDIKIIGIEPKDSPVLTEGRSGPHGIQGIGANFVPKTLDTKIYDKIVTATTEDAYTFARLTGRKEGVLIGISSGAALWAAVEEAKENEGKNIVVLFPDLGDKYLSTPLYN